MIRNTSRKRSLIDLVGRSFYFNRDQLPRFGDTISQERLHFENYGSDTRLSLIWIYICVRCKVYRYTYPSLLFISLSLFHTKIFELVVYNCICFIPNINLISSPQHCQGLSVFALAWSHMLRQSTWKIAVYINICIHIYLCMKNKPIGETVKARSNRLDQ